ncbi:hypothetical protein [Bacillus cereus]
MKILNDMKKGYVKLALNDGVSIGIFLIGMGAMLAVIGAVGVFDQSKIQYNSWGALYFTGIGVGISSSNIIALDDGPPKKNNIFYWIAIILSVALIMSSHIYGLKDVVVTGFAIIGIGIGIIRPIQVKIYQEKYPIIPGELIGWGVFNNKERQITIINASNMFVVMDYYFSKLDDTQQVHNYDQYRFEDIDAARRFANGQWQVLRNNNKGNCKIFFETK